MDELLPNFQQEVELLETLRCPYVINFIGSVVEGERMCLVTEFCPLGSLRKHMKKYNLSETMKIRICQDIARGMEYLHENDVIHRDLKTDNVLMISNNPNDSIVCKVTDFGTARSFIESSKTITMHKIGTPVYMAPEVIKKQQMTFKCDVFSFAVCMLEIWLGREPYLRTRFPDTESIFTFVTSGRRLDIPEDCIFYEMIEESWAEDPADRPTFKVLVNILIKLERSLKYTNSTQTQHTDTSKEDHSKSKSLRDKILGRRNIFSPSSDNPKMVLSPRYPHQKSSTSSDESNISRVLSNSQSDTQSEEIDYRNYLDYRDESGTVSLHSYDSESSSPLRTMTYHKNNFSSDSETEEGYNYRNIKRMKSSSSSYSSSSKSSSSYSE